MSLVGFQLVLQADQLLAVTGGAFCHPGAQQLDVAGPVRQCLLETPVLLRQLVHTLAQLLQFLQADAGGGTFNARPAGLRFDVDHRFLCSGAVHEAGKEVPGQEGRQRQNQPGQPARRGGAQFSQDFHRGFR